MTTAYPWGAENAIWGAGFHDSVRKRLGHSAMWGIIAEDLPEEHNRSCLDPVNTDRAGRAGGEDRLPDEPELLRPHALPRGAREGVAGGGRRVRDRDRAVHPRDRLAPARHAAVMGDDPATSVVDGFGQCARRPEPVHLRRQHVADVGGHEPDGDDRRDGAALGRAPDRVARASMAVAAHEPRPRAQASGELADVLIPARGRDAVRERGRRRRRVAGRGAGRAAGLRDAAAGLAGSTAASAAEAIAALPERDPAGWARADRRRRGRLLHEPGRVRAGRLRRAAGDPVRPGRAADYLDPAGLREGAAAGVSSDPLRFRVADPDGRYAAVRLSLATCRSRRRRSFAPRRRRLGARARPAAGSRGSSTSSSVEHADGTTERVARSRQPAPRARARSARSRSLLRAGLRAAGVARRRRRRGRLRRSSSLRGRGLGASVAGARLEPGRRGPDPLPLLVAHDGPEYDALAGLTQLRRRR